MLVSYEMLYLLILEILIEANIGHDAQNKSDDSANKKATIIFRGKVESQKEEK